ncbi:AWPM-19-like family protein [Quillaja saponaria]|uniref:AWPM-19-like family protein n=1 Tax=Quillaja saponaria TaxID=32244 RepID=A0AAD7M2Q1_QUISA|nr:AWPM-19-like family protein [Quillaja saponaria]
MANENLKPVASLLLVLNFSMYVIILGIGGWAMNRAIDHGFVIGPGFDLPAHFSPIYFPMGNAATGFFSLPSAASVATIAWSLTLLAMGFGCKEIQLQIRNARLRTIEAFLIILSATQLFYIAAIHAARRYS